MRQVPWQHRGSPEDRVFASISFRIGSDDDFFSRGLGDVSCPLAQLRSVVVPCQCTAREHCGRRISTCTPGLSKWRTIVIVSMSSFPDARNVSIDLRFYKRGI